MNPQFENLLQNPVPWLCPSSRDSDIAISSRIRLARNLDSMPFPINAEKDILQTVRSSILTALRKQIPDYEQNWFKFNMETLSETERELFFERRLISSEFKNDAPASCLAVHRTEQLGIMINEEDHLRIQTIRNGFCLRELWTEIDRFDDLLSTELSFAFDSSLGYLTSCPTNVGTGMRASVMLHLPALVLTQQDKPMIQAMAKLNLAIRGLHGEGSEIVGNLFQISNQSTLGESEEKIIDRLNAVISQVIINERITRRKLLEQQRMFLMNYIGRAFGKLKYAYIISSKETLDALSALRLGVDLGLFTNISIDTVNRLFIMAQPASIQVYQDHPLPPEERGIIRAGVIRNALKDA